MALVSGYSVTVSAQTQSDHIALPAGAEYCLTFSSAGAFALDLQRLAGDGSSWDDLHYDATTQVTIDSTTGPQSVVVVAGKYRMDVTTYNNPITMWAEEV